MGGVDPGRWVLLPLAPHRIVDRDDDDDDDGDGREGGKTGAFLPSSPVPRSDMPTLHVT